MTAEKKTKKIGTKKSITSKKGAAATTRKAAVKKSGSKKTLKKSVKKPSFQEIVKSRLLEEKEKILNDVSAKIRAESSVHKRESGDIYDIASNERERELALTLGDRDRKKLSEIDLALERINEGSYGECEECGEPVAEKRLEVLPFTRVCVDCQSKFERDLRIRGATDDSGAE